MAGPIVLDSSAWIAIFDLAALAAKCEAELSKAKQVYVPTLIFYEVYRRISSRVSESHGLACCGIMSQYAATDLTKEVALLAADLSLHHQLGMADSIILAHAYELSATLVTLDNDFINIPQVKVIRG